MRVAIVLASTGATQALEVAADIDVLNFKAFVAIEVGVAPEDVTIIHDGKTLTDNSRTLEAYGVKEDDLLQVNLASAKSSDATSYSHTAQARQSSSAARGGSARGANALASIDFSSVQVPTHSVTSGARQPSAGASKTREDSESIRKQFLGMPQQRSLLSERNPDLAAALNDPVKFKEVYERQMREIREQNEARQQLARGDITDPSIQQRIFDEIQQRNLDAQLELALEENPEFYTKVTMLYIDVMVGNFAVKAFVDSGAQMTIMSLACARRCNLERLIDKRFSGLARGVGEQKIVGRIHKYELVIGGVLFETSFQVLEEQEIDLLIGLDMLRRHQACIDLKRNVLAFGNGHECPFLHENELPEYARLNAPNELSASQPRSPAPPQPDTSASTSTAAASSPKSAGKLSEEKITKLCGYGFTRAEAVQELTVAGGDFEKALAALLAKSLMLPGSSAKRT